jgi:GH25 family lysozyme M1 (1,4-beta-N-acetylmuramidase)
MIRNYFFISIVFYFSFLPAQQPQGIDVSHHQGSINWNLVYQSGKVFAFVKATEGYTYNDPRFVTNMTDGNAAGVMMGAYHFARPDNNSATDEANHFVQVAGNYIGNGWLPPVLDLEDPPGQDLQQLYTPQQLTDWVQTWLTTVENLTGVEPIIYTNGRYTNYLLSSLNSYRLWIAEPDGNTNPPDNLGRWTTWAFKQYSWTGSVPGISGDVDLNVFNGTMSELTALTQGGGVGTVTLDCSSAVALQCGDLYHGSESADTSRVYSYGCNGWTETGPERVHTVTPSQNGNLAVTISGFSGDLDVYILNSCDPADCHSTVNSSSAYLMNVQAGQTYYVVVDADDGSGSAYDIFVHCPSTGIPDDISLNNAVITSGNSVDAGSDINLYVKQYYAGTSTNVPQVEVGYFLSTDCQRDNSDVFLGSSVSTIDAGSRTEIEYETFTIPSSTHHGQYYILFVADYLNAVAESSEQNNTLCLPLYVNNSVSVDEAFKNRIQIYPNPVQEILYVETDDNVQVQRLRIFEISGQQVLQFEGLTGPIDVSGLKKGIYLLEIIDREGRRAVIRFAKR